MDLYDIVISVRQWRALVCHSSALEGPCAPGICFDGGLLGTSGRLPHPVAFSMGHGRLYLDTTGSGTPYEFLLTGHISNQTQKHRQIHQTKMQRYGKEAHRLSQFLE